MDIKEPLGFGLSKNNQIKEFENCNETMKEDELNKMIAETMYMADRPRTWTEWFGMILRIK